MSALYPHCFSVGASIIWPLLIYKVVLLYMSLLLIRNILLLKVLDKALETCYDSLHQDSTFLWVVYGDLREATFWQMLETGLFCLKAVAAGIIETIGLHKNLTQLICVQRMQHAGLPLHLLCSLCSIPATVCVVL